MLLGVLYQLEDERRHAHDAVGMYAVDGVPLQFGDAVAHTYDARTQLADAEEIGQARHKALVDGGHQLQHVARLEAGADKRYFLVVGQTLQVFLAAGKGYGVAGGARGGYVVDDFLTRDAQKIVVVPLQVAFGSEGYLLQVFQSINLCNVDAVGGEHAFVKRRVGSEILQVFAQFLFLKTFYHLAGLVFYFGTFHCKGFMLFFSVFCTANPNTLSHQTTNLTLQVCI